MFIENFSTMVQNADQATDLVRVLVDLTNGYSAAVLQDVKEAHHGSFLVGNIWFDTFQSWV